MRRPIRKRYDWYCSGPISSYGTPEDNIKRFHEVARALRNAGHRVFNPPENEPSGLSWQQYLEMDLVALVASRGVVTLPNWERSKGARLEVNIAKRLGMPVRSVEEVLREVS